LEIQADDVRCTHGATTGASDDEMIFYAQCRGLTRKEATRLIVAGFFQQVFDRSRSTASAKPSAKPSAGGFANTISRITKSVLRNVYIDRPSWSVMRPIRPLKLRIDRRYNADSSHADGCRRQKVPPDVRFVLVAKVSDLPDPGKKLVEVEDRLVVLFIAAGKFSALDDVCTHDGGRSATAALDCQAGTIGLPSPRREVRYQKRAAVTCQRRMRPRRMK